MTVTAKAPPVADERLSKPRLLDQLVVRPEIGAMLGVSKQAAQRKYGTKTTA